MTKTQSGTRIALKSILYLTDFSEASEAALPFVTAIAAGYGAKVHVLHVLTPAIPETCIEAIHADQGLANIEMVKVDFQLDGVAHDSTIASGVEIWPAVKQAIQDRSVDLIVLGTHGRTRAKKFLFGSCAEEILRRSSVPVLTIGPHVRKGATPDGCAFRSILFATDFSKPCAAAAPFAISLAEENDAQLTLLYVTPKFARSSERSEPAGAELMQRLENIVPDDAKQWCHSSPMLQCGDVADRILAGAIELVADVIVLGVRNAADHLEAATHLERAIAHKVVAHARCPVLTVRG